MKKKRVMVACKKAQALVCSVAVNSMQIERVDYFKYLGSWITSDGRSDMDVNVELVRQSKRLWI